MLLSLNASLPKALQQSFQGKDEDSTPDAAQSHGIDSTPLNGIFSSRPYDTSQPFGVQYPRVALTILTAPPDAAENWAAAQHFGQAVEPSCFSLSAVIWTSARASQTVPPFNACFPNNDPRSQGIPLSGMSDWTQTTGFYSVIGNESTGTRRTNGPIPPALPVPTSPIYQRFYGGYPTLESSSIAGGMFATLLLQMGFDWSISQDRRVWITSIVPVQTN
jgi:hypothetical protein